MHSKGDESGRQLRHGIRSRQGGAPANLARLCQMPSIAVAACGASCVAGIQILAHKKTDKAPWRPGKPTWRRLQAGVLACPGLHRVLDSDSASKRDRYS